MCHSRSSLPAHMNDSSKGGGPDWNLRRHEGRRTNSRGVNSIELEDEGAGCNSRQQGVRNRIVISETVRGGWGGTHTATNWRVANPEDWEWDPWGPTLLRHLVLWNLWLDRSEWMGPRKKKWEKWESERQKQRKKKSPHTHTHNWVKKIRINRQCNIFTETFSFFILIIFYIIVIN